MEESYTLRYHSLEGSHWWFCGRRDLIYKLIKDFPRNVNILEVGCSGGVLIEFLKEKGFNRLCGIDIDEKAIEICKERGISDIKIADAENTGFEDNQFDIIIASDVLEHIKNEDKALLEWHRILKKDGRLIVFVPAFNFLWSKHDEINHHYRRYSKSELTRILENKGFKIEQLSSWNFILFFPISMVKLYQRILRNSKNKTGGQLFGVNKFLNKTLFHLLMLENKVISNGINFPLGISIFAAARKK